MLYYLQSYSVILIETVFCIIFFEIFSTKSKKHKSIWTAKLIAIFSLSVLTCVVTILLREHLIVKLAVNIGLTVSIMSIYLKETVIKCIVLCLIHEGLIWLADFITLLIYPWLLQPDILESEMDNFLVVILSKLFLFLIIIILNNMFQNNNTRYINKKDWTIFLIIPISSIVIALIFVKNIQFVTTVELKQLFTGIALWLVCINIIMFYFMQNIGKREYLLHEKAMLELETKNQLKLYETISEQVTNQRKLSHEYKNQLTCIQSLCATEEYGQLKNYLEQINGEVLHDLDYIDTGNSFVNAVLNAKYEEAERKNILIICKINDLSGLAINSSDLVILLSNLLNNAIEACERCNKEREIKIKCVFTNNEFILSIKNNYNGNLNKIGENLFTTKEQDKENHGIGLKNVIQIVEKNEGYYAVEHTDNEFWISVVIPQRIHK